MRLIFAGTPEFAATALAALLAAGHQIVLVLTQPDRPAGRGMKLQPSPVKQLALRHGLPLQQPASLKSAQVQAQLAEVRADAMVVAAYGLILPPPVLALPQFGCINIHASLLPRWRGAAPIQRALLAGDAHTGISIMQMDVGLDTGAVLLTEAIPITAQDTAQSLHDRLAALGARLIVQALAGLERGELSALPQAERGASYADKIAKHEALLDWSKPAPELARAVRAFNPYPGAYSLHRGEALKVWSALEAEGAGQPGQVLRADKAGVLVACGAGALLLTELQKAGGKRLGAAGFLAGSALSVGEVLGA